MISNPMPKVIQEWQQLISNPPKVCYNCEFYAVDVCRKYNAKPPETFANTPNLCPEWLESIPF